MVYETLQAAQMKKGNNIEGFFILRSANIKTTSGGSPFLLCTLSDATGEIGGKIWNYADTIHERIGEVIKVRGQVEEYNGSLQINIKLVRPVQESDQVDMSLVLPTVPFPLEQYKARLESFLNGIQDPGIKSITEHIYAKYGEAFLSWPAAKSIHHAFPGGLLTHTVNMMSMAVAVDSYYSAALAGFNGGRILCLDLLLAACFCHDIGKLKEFSCASTGLVTDYTLEGSLLGHSALGAQEVLDAARAVGLDDDDERVTLLRHMLISHHGEAEYGAAVEPLFLEAEILSRLDMMDSRIEIYTEMLTGSLESGKMAYSNALGHRIYKPVITFGER